MQSIQYLPWTLLSFCVCWIRSLWFPFIVPSGSDSCNYQHCQFLAELNPNTRRWASSSSSSSSLISSSRLFRLYYSPSPRQAIFSFPPSFFFKKEKEFFLFLVFDALRSETTFLVFYFFFVVRLIYNIYRASVRKNRKTGKKKGVSLSSLLYPNKSEGSKGVFFFG